MADPQMYNKEETKIKESSIAHYLYTYYKGWYVYNDLNTNKSDYTLYKTIKHNNQNIIVNVITIIDRKNNKIKKPKISQEYIRDFKDLLTNRLLADLDSKKVFLLIIEVEDRDLTQLEKKGINTLKSGVLELFSNFRYCYCHLNTKTSSAWTNSKLYGYFWVKSIKKALDSPRLEKKVLARHESAYGNNPNGKTILGIALVSLYVAIYVLFAWKTDSILEASSILTIKETSPQVLKDLGAIALPLTSYGQFFYQSLSSSFLHLSLTHLIVNSLILLFVSNIVERILGKIWYITIYTLGAVVSGLFVFMLSEPNTIVMGSSGAIMALQAAVVLPLIFRIPQGCETTNIAPLLITFFIASLLPLYADISYAAHFGGATIGLILGYIISRSWKFGEIKFPVKTVDVIFAIACCCCLLISIAALFKNLLT